MGTSFRKPSFLLFATALAAMVLMAFNARPAFAKPDFPISISRVGWQSYSDYQQRQLHVEYSMINPYSSFINVDITSSTNTNGVRNLSQFPVTAFFVDGPNGLDPTILAELDYQVPEGVASFRASLTATCTDWYDGTWLYP